MSVFKNRAGHWSVRLQIGGQRIQRTLGASATKQQAQEYEAKIRQDAIAGKLGKAPERSIEEALVRWLQGEASTLKSLDNLKSKVRAIIPHCESRRLTDIVEVAEKVKSAGIEANLNPATINRRLAILRRIANLAYDQWGWIDVDLGAKIKTIKGEKARHIYLTPEEVERLADSCRHAVVATAIRLAARTGLRESELLQANTIFDGCIVVGDSKNGKPRLVPLPVDMLELRLPLGITYSTLRTHFEEARKAAGMEGVRFHDLRHTAASWWAQSGANMAVIRDLLGHSTLAVTSRYAHLSTGDLKRHGAKMAQFISEDERENEEEVKNTN